MITSACLFFNRKYTTTYRKSRRVLCQVGFVNFSPLSPSASLSARVAWALQEFGCHNFFPQNTMFSQFSQDCGVLLKVCC